MTGIDWRPIPSAASYEASENGEIRHIQNRRVRRNKEKIAHVAKDYAVAAATISEIMSAKIYCAEWGMKP